MWHPEVGERVTLTYPPNFGGIAFPQKRVGEVTYVGEDGRFEILVQPQQHRVMVVPEEYIRAGATWRRWEVKDGWSHGRIRRGKDKKKR